MDTYERTDEQTEVNPKVHRLRRETKNQTIQIHLSEEKWENLILSLLKRIKGV